MCASKGRSVSFPSEPPVNLASFPGPHAEPAEYCPPPRTAPGHIYRRDVPNNYSYGALMDTDELTRPGSMFNSSQLRNRLQLVCRRLLRLQMAHLPCKSHSSDLVKTYHLLTGARSHIICG